MDTFFTQTHCDRCGQELTGGRTMSMFNTDCICMTCKAKERGLPTYEKAVKAENEALKRGVRDFPGIGLEGSENS